MMRKHQQHKYGLAATAMSLLATVPVSAQVQELNVQRDTIPTYLKIQNKGIVNNALDVLNGNAAGVTSDIATLSTIYPADIESFSVLKNAAETALYGSRGASGVIEVKTKKGTGKGFQISYETNIGMERMSKKLDMLSAGEYLATAKKLGVYANNGGHDNNFYDVITRTGFVQNHYLAFSGGSEQSNYRASFGYIDHNTIIKTKDYNNFVAKIDVTQHAFDNRLKGDFGVFGSTFKNNDIFDSQMLFYSVACQNPTYPAGRDANGNWTKNGSAYRINPPSAVLVERSDQKEMYFSTHMRLVYDIAPSLKLSAFGSYSYTSNENSEFCPTWVWAQGNVYRGEFKNQEYLGNVSLDYAHTWNAHTLSAGISTEYHYQEHTAFWTHAKGITTNDFGYDNIGATSSRPYGGTGSTYDDMSLASVMANASYTLYNKYKLTLTMRSDGSSMVGDDHTWGFFPSVSAEWDIKKEQFLRSFDGISTLKLRTGYGRSGNLGGITAYTTMENVQQTGIVPVNNTPTVTLGTIRNNNPDLKWETKSTFNIGGEIGLWHNRLMLTAEYYYSKTSDMLYSYDVPVPPFAYDKLLANIGSMSNQGLEIGFSIAPVQTKDIDLNVSMNLSFQKNKLLSLSGNYNGMNMSAPNITAIGSIDGAGQNGGDNNHVLYQIVGQPLGVFYLPHCTGLYKDEQGTMKYKIEDLDRNGTIDFGDGGDRRICGQATPKATLGSNISLRYKDFYMSLQMNGAFGHKIFNGTALAYNNMSSFPTYNVLKGAPEKNIVDQNVSDYWLESGDYLNFEYLTIGYNIPVKSRIVRSLRVSCSVNNLATITSYSGLTPMINSYVVNSSMGIDDKRCYPTYRTYSVGVSVQF